MHQKFDCNQSISTVIYYVVGTWHSTQFCVCLRVLILFVCSWHHLALRWKTLSIHGKAWQMLANSKGVNVWFFSDSNLCVFVSVVVWKWLTSFLCFLHKPLLSSDRALNVENTNIPAHLQLMVEILKKEEEEEYENAVSTETMVAGCFRFCCFCFCALLLQTYSCFHWYVGTLYGTSIAFEHS